MVATFGVVVWGWHDTVSNGYLGLQIGEYAPAVQGWKIEKVIARSPAAQKDISSGWKVTHVQGRALSAVSLIDFPEGIASRDRLQAWKRWQHWLRQQIRPGRTLTLTLKKENRRRRVRLTAKRKPIWLVVRSGLVYILVGIVFAVLGMAVVKRRPAFRPARLLLWFCVLHQAFLFTQTQTEAPRMLTMPWAASQVFFDASDALQMIAAVAIVHFCACFVAVFPTKEKRVFPFVYAVAAGAYLIYFFRIASPLLLVFIPLSYVIAFFLLFWRYRDQDNSPDQRKQIKWLMWGGGVPVTFLVLVWILEFLLDAPVSRSDSSVLLALSTLAFPTATVLAILRYRLFDIDVIVRRSIMAAVALPLVGLAYSWVVKSVGGALIPGHPPLLLMVAVLFLIILLPGQVRVEERLDRWFGRNRYNARQRLHDLAGRLADLAGVQEVAAEAAATVQKSLELENCAVFLTDVDEEKLTPRRAGSWRSAPRAMPFSFLEKLPQLCRPVFVQAHFGAALPDALGVPAPVLIVPLAAGARSLGFLAIGPRAGRATWQRADLEALVLVARALALTTDRANHRLLLRKVREMQAQIVHTGRLAALGTLAAGVAHELNTPLGYVRSNAQLLKQILPQRNDAQGIEEMVELVGDIEAGANQMTQVVSNLRSFTQVDSQGTRAVDLNQCVRQSLAMLESSRPAGVQVTVDLGTIEAVLGVPAQLNQMVVNLVTNAWDACERKGRVAVSTRQEAEQVVLEVDDDGPGISAQVAERMFDPFYTTKTVGRNMGLGLSITRNIVESHGGTLTVQNKPGERGAAARVELPKQKKA
jgi:C4-dicarboxylate-specific signal transduction histidine kinase